MAESGTVEKMVRDVPKLTATNGALWKEKITLALQKASVWTYVTHTFENMKNSLVINPHYIGRKEAAAIQMKLKAALQMAQGVPHGEIIEVEDGERVVNQEPPGEQEDLDIIYVQEMNSIGIDVLSHMITWWNVVQPED